MDNMWVPALTRVWLARHFGPDVAELIVAHLRRPTPLFRCHACGATVLVEDQAIGVRAGEPFTYLQSGAGLCVRSGDRVTFLPIAERPASPVGALAGDRLDATYRSLRLGPIVYDNAPLVPMQLKPYTIRNGKPVCTPCTITTTAVGSA